MPLYSLPADDGYEYDRLQAEAAQFKGFNMTTRRRSYEIGCLTQWYKKVGGKYADIERWTPREVRTGGGGMS